MSNRPLLTQRRARRNLGLWRVAPAIPAAGGSAALMLVLLSWAGGWEPAAMLAWLAVGPALLTRPGDRVALRAGRFRPLTVAHGSHFETAVADAVHRCGIEPNSVDLYVTRGGDVNAYTAGRRGIAVSSGLLAAVAAGRLSTPMVTGVLVHELGHIATGATRYILAARWWAAPWRAASRFVLGVAFRVGRRQPPRLLVSVVLTAVTVAIVQAAQRHDLAVVAVLAALVLFGVSVPLLDAAISCHCERVADRYATAAGASHELASALSAVRADPARPSVLARRLARHPHTEQRIEALLRWRMVDVQRPGPVDRSLP